MQQGLKWKLATLSGALLTLWAAVAMTLAQVELLLRHAQVVQVAQKSELVLVLVLALGLVLALALELAPKRCRQAHQLWQVLRVTLWLSLQGEAVAL